MNKCTRTTGAIRLIAMAVCLMTWLVGTTAKAQSLEINPQSNWREGQGANPLTDDWKTQNLPNGGMRFTVNQPGHAMVRNFGTRLEIDTRRTPTMSMTYRATGMKPSRKDHPFMVFYRLEKNKSLRVLTYKDLVIDGQEHTVTVDLIALFAKQKIDEQVLPYFDLRFFAGKDGPGSFELLSLRFSEFQGLPKLPGQPVEPTHGKPVSIQVIDEMNQPIKQARVILDDHLLGKCRVEVLTDEQGKATLRPWFADLPGTRRTLRVQATNRYTLTYRDLTQVDDTTILKARLFPTRTYTGIFLR